MSKTRPRKYLLQAVFLALAIVARPGAGAAFSSRNLAFSPVPWNQLPYYLARRGVEPDQRLPLCDCPRGIDESRPTHQVIQVIANTVYEWREYRFTDESGRPRMALTMTRPRKKFLSEREARVLLTAAAQWRRQTPLPAGNRATVRIPDPAVSCRLPGNQTSARDPDARSASFENLQSIDPARLEQSPCNTIACLDINDQGSSYRGTGFQVSPYCFLTAGHNVFWKNHWVDEISVIPAQHPGNDGYLIIEPYGRQLCPRRNFRSNLNFTRETGSIDISEFDYGAILLEHPFTGIDTFMPLEFYTPGQPLPDRVEIAGYPLYPDPGLHASSAAWSANGLVYNSPDGDYRQFINFTAPIFGGNSGSPVCYRNFLGQVRVIAVTTWRNLTMAGGGGVLLTALNEKLIRGWLSYTPVPNFSETGYIPFFCNRDGSWTGLALANPGDEECSVKVEYFSSEGLSAGNQPVSIKAHGQAALVCAPNQDPDCATGWIKVSSTRPVYGFALVGRNTPSTMFDINLCPALAKKLLFPYLAAHDLWESTVMACNPDTNTAAALHCTYLPPDGTALSADTSIPAGGSLALNLEKLFRQPLDGGQLIIASSRPIAAFLLYDNTATAADHPDQPLWRAGLGAIPWQSD